MEIPNTLEEMESYFDRVLKLLESWSWIYEHRATDILLSDSLNSGYLDVLEELDNYSLNQLPLGVTKEYWPAELTHFIEECSQLSLIIPADKNVQSSQLEIPRELKKGTSKKKEHEINQLAKYVLKHCAEYDITRVYDIGSGLGYVDRILTTFGHLSVIGIEADVSKIATANKMNRELLKTDKYLNIDYIENRLDNNTLEDISKQLRLFEERGCLIGLHACGDLSSVALRLYMSMDKVSSLILMPCCYHKMVDSSSFPISKILSKKLSSNRRLTNTTFLRLASESTKERWVLQTEESHNTHAFCVLARAVMQSFLAKHKYKAIRHRRKCVTKQHRSEWAEYVTIWLERHTLIDENNMEVNNETIYNELVNYWTIYSDLLNRIEAYTGLQVCLQSVAESLLIVDRLSFLLESEQISNATVIRITDPSISPRSVAIVANKL